MKRSLRTAFIGMWIMIVCLGLLNVFTELELIQTRRDIANLYHNDNKVLWPQLEAHKKYIAALDRFWNEQATWDRKVLQQVNAHTKLFLLQRDPASLPPADTETMAPPSSPGTPPSSMEIAKR